MIVAARSGPECPPGGPWREQTKPIDYLTLDQALADEVTAISEVSESGSVPRVLVVNRLGTDQLLDRLGGALLLVDDVPVHLQVFADEND